MLLIQTVTAIAISFTAFKVILSLNCKICAEKNLGEFDDCTDQFQYNCVNYQKRFSPNEKIFCRTTRHKSPNDTYTIVKECIAESAHYSTFPRKIYELNEECDVIDVDGNEVAYCICRNTDNCNKNSIVDQFTAFEDVRLLIINPPLDSSRQKIQNYPQFFDQEKSSEELTSSKVASSSATPTELFTISSGRAITSDITRPSVQTTDKTKPASSFIATKSLPSKNPSVAPSIHQDLRCLQCSQSDLKSINADCANPVVVSCQPDGRSFCFSRQIVMAADRIGVEKMCLTEKSVLEEFGDGAKALLKNAISEGATCHNAEFNGFRSYFCICASSLCNKPPVSALMNTQAELQTAAPSIPTFFTKKPNDKTFGTTGTTISATIPKGKIAGNDIENLYCAVCTEADLKNPLQDCEQNLRQNCAQMIKNEKAYCVTRQTEHESGLFTIEKSCVSKSQFYTLHSNEREKSLLSEQISLGCGSSDDGRVNYCICEGEMCNNESLAQQGEEFAKSKSIPTSIVFKTSRSQQHLKGNAEGIDATSSHQSTISHSSASIIDLPSTTRVPLIVKYNQNTLSNIRAENSAGATRRQPSSSRTETSSTDALGTTIQMPDEDENENPNSLKERLEKWKEATVTASFDASFANPLMATRWDFLIITLSMAIYLWA